MKYHRLFLVLFLLSMLLITACEILPSASGPRERAESQDATPTPIPTPIVPVKTTYTVEQGEVISLLEFTGRLAPVIESELFFRVDGRVRNIFARRNDVISEGQILADLEIDHLERQLEAAQFDLEAAQNRLAEAEADLASRIMRSQIRLEMTQLRLAKAEFDAHADAQFEAQNEAIEAQTRSIDQVKAQIELQRASIALRKAQEAYDEVAWRGDAGATSQAEDLERATLAFAKAEADYASAIQDTSTRRLNSSDFDIALQELEVALAQLDLIEIQESIDPRLRDDRRSIELNIERIEAEIAEATLIAPFSGQLLSFNAIEGRAVQAFEPVAVLADPAELEVRADLIDSTMQKLSEDIPVLISPNNRPGETVVGTIRLLPYPYGSGTSPIEANSRDDESTRVTIDNPAERDNFKQGSLVKVTVELERKDSVLWLPPQAIRTFSGRDFVVVQEGDIQRRVDVKVGIKSEERVEIEEGLTEGQTIIGE